jgi:hypothetical protein
VRAKLVWILGELGAFEEKPAPPPEAKPPEDGR